MSEAQSNKADYTLASERAASLLARHGARKPPVKVHEMAATLGLNIQEGRFESPYDRDIQGYLDWAKKTIVLNADDGYTRKRFTIAHELGHVMLHQKELEANPDLGIMYRQALGMSDPDPKEREANHFAACLLMPASMVLRFKDVPSTRTIAGMFIVSEQAMKFRLESLEKEY